ncbi:hypothetical protein Pelo_13780 [Pelomyxa schiedti]|nr:hypothetical protein Pelo_13780 [Pelomyxa schiedti]
MESVCCMNGVGLTNYTPILNLPEERRPATSDGRYVLEHPNTGQSEPTVIESRSTAGPAYKTMWHLAVRLEDLSQRDTTDVVTMGAAKETKQSALAYWIPFRPALWSSVPSYVEDTSQEAEPDFALCEGSKRNSIRPSLSITPKAVVSPSDPSILLLQSLPV